MAKRKKQRRQPALRVEHRVENVVQLSDTGTPQIRQHFAVVVTGEGKKRQAQVLDHPLLYYKSRHEISEAQFLGGIWLHSDYEVSHQHKTAFSFMRAELGISVTVEVDYENPHTALERYRRAMKCLPPVARVFAQEVCIEGQNVAAVRVNFPNWNRKNNGMDRFREVLDQLFDFYTEDKKAADDRKRRIDDQRQRDYERTFADPTPSNPSS